MNRRKKGGKQEHDPTWTQPITQPFPDWVHIAEAPFYCLSDGRMHAAKGWAEAFCEEVRLIASKRPGEIWTLHANENMMFVEADTLDVCTMISPGYFNIGEIAPKVGSDWWSISDFGVSARSTAIPAYARPAADVHLAMISSVLFSLRQNFGKAIYSGAAHIMARPRSALSAFERIAPDQWHYFKLDRETDDEKPLGSLTFGFGREASATGPQGEKLYSIFVAPGTKPESATMQPETQCRHQLGALLSEFPERPPQPLALLAKKFVHKIPGLTERGFRRALSLAQHDRGNHNWKLPGAPRKSPQESWQNK